MTTWLQTVLQVTLVVTLNSLAALVLYGVSVTISPWVALVAFVLGIATAVWWIER